MTTSSDGNSPGKPVVDADRDRILSALEEFCVACDQGQPFDRQRFLQEHADVADELTKCLDGLELINDMAVHVGDVKSDSESTSDTLPRSLGDFRIMREIGRGGMGIVYEAEQLSLGRRVALKVLPFASLLDRQQLERFKNEVRAAAMLKHPHIVSVYQTGYDRGVHYYAMELIEGQTLSDQIHSLQLAKTGESCVEAPSSHSESRREAREQETVPNAALSTQFPSERQEFFRNVARLGRQAAESLEHAHRQGVIHRDIKPSNLLLDVAGDLYVTDFGLARVQTTGDLTLTGDLIGTLRYMSPEQLDDACAVDARGDIYSLGVTLYELLTLRAAHPQTRRAELTRSIVESEPRALRKIDPTIPRDLETIVQTSMAKEVSQRYRSMQELADDLDRFLNCQSIQATPPTRVDRAAKWLQRNQMLAWLVAAAMLSFACVASIGWLREGRLRREHERANTNLQTALQSVFKPPYKLQDQIDPVIVSAMASKSLATMERLDRQIPTSMRREFDLGRTRLLVIRARSLVFQGRPSLEDAKQAEQVSRRWLHATPSMDEAALLLSQAYDLQAANHLMDLRSADRVAAQGERLLLADRQGDDRAHERAWLHGLMSNALRWAGRLRDSKYHCRTAWHHLANAESQGRFTASSWLVRYELTKTLASLRRWDELRNVIEEADRTAAERFKARGLHLDYWYALYRLAVAQISNMQGEFDTAIPILNEVVEDVTLAQQRMPSFIFFEELLVSCNQCLSDAHALRGELRQAEQFATEAIRRSLGRTQLPLFFQRREAEARNRLGHILYAMDLRPRARDEFETAIAQLESICSQRPFEPTCNRILLGTLATCPFEDLRDPPKQAALASRLMTDETGWLRSVLALAFYWNDRFDHAVEITDQLDRDQESDAICKLIAAMAYAKLNNDDAAQQEYEAAMRDLAGNTPVLFGGIAPCALEWLKTEANALLSKRDELDAGGIAANTRYAHVRREHPDQPAIWGPDIIVNR